VALEDIVFLFLRALGALDAAHKKDSHSHGDHKSNYGRASRKPLSQTMHNNPLVAGTTTGNEPPKKSPIPNYDAMFIQEVCMGLKNNFALAK
jgi:hypothetical protein